MLPKIILESFIEIFWKDILLDLCVQNMKFSIKDFLTKCNQIRMKQRGFGNIYKNFHFLLTQPWNFSYWLVDWPLFYKFDLEADTVQKWSFSFKISSVNMKKSLTENFISCAVRGVFRGCVKRLWWTFFVENSSFKKASLHKKLSFLSSIFSVNVRKSAVSCGFGLTY